MVRAAAVLYVAMQNLVSGGESHTWSDVEDSIIDNRLDACLSDYWNKNKCFLNCHVDGLVVPAGILRTLQGPVLLARAVTVTSSVKFEARKI